MKASYEFACYKNAAIHFLRYELSRVDYLWIIVISSLDSYSDGTHSLQRIHW